MASRQNGIATDFLPVSPVVGSASPAAAGHDVQGPVMEELIRRLRVRERELSEANAKIEMLMAEKRRGADSAERKRLSLDPSSLSLGAVSREDSNVSVGWMSASGMSGATTSDGTLESELEIKKLKERMKIVEEALRAMRDEAREHVLAIKSQDIVLNRLLGSGSFAEVHSATWHLPCAVKRLKVCGGAEGVGGAVHVRVCQYSTHTNTGQCACVSIHTHTQTQDNVRHNKYEVQKFQREAYLLRSLLHPGVLRVLGFCKVDHALFFSLSFSYHYSLT